MVIIHFLKALPIVDECKGLLNSVLSLEGNIFEGCKITWNPFKKALHVGLLEDAFKLKGQAFLKLRPRYFLRWQTQWVKD